ncbi:glycosyltransferase family 4 protein [Limibaculum sp. M0105]|uniref:Glycosyltransferase family 4 protein n=1 Tax=Thermohalobaculum xanthum TaxID=2753746 RepID=A0A8J7SFZ0_9RHOB|nr:glycosyltransferase family 4 protein [Thermohalobaculum xanthum]MBK0398735.1 glycosyltransferase family 4 protein [Thermohalobaculum xanthum]
MHVIFPFTGDGLGGSHVSAMTLIEGLLAQGDVSATIVAGETTQVADEVRRRGLPFFPSGEGPIRRRDVVRYVGGVLHRRRRLAALQSGTPAVVHYNDLEAAFAWQPAARLLGLRSVYHHRALPRMNAVKRSLLRTMDHTITISDVCRGNLGFLPDREVTVITNPIKVETDVLAATDRRQLHTEFGLPGDAAVFGFLGNLADRKRPDFFIDAAQEIAARMPNAVFVMFGRDREFSREQLEAQARALGIGDKVRVAGFRSPIEGNLALIDLLLAPAIDEPFGRTPVEAALCGIPYVVTDDAGQGEIVRRWGGGAAVPKLALPSEFADVAVRVMQSRDAFRLPQEKREGLRADVSPAAHAARVRAIYDAICAGPAARDAVA